MEICCDSCPLTPTCEEIADFERDALHLADGDGGAPDADDSACLFEDEDDYLDYLPAGRVEDMLRYPDNRHLY